LDTILAIDKPKLSPVSSTEQIETTAQLAAEIWTQHYTAIIGAEQVAYMLAKFQSKAAITQQISEGYQYYLLDSKNPSGYLCLKQEDNALFISKIYLKANQRGKGFGKVMMEFTKNQAINLGVNELRLTVNKYNTKTISAYEKMGFSKKREVVFDIGNGYIMDDYEMILNL
jgi:ribosomal protein S18 acetylase RimI-like enzyme